MAISERTHMRLDAARKMRDENPPHKPRYREDSKMNNVAYIYSHDGDEDGVKFSVAMCSTEETLRATVRKHLDPDGTDPEFDGLYDALLEAGSYDFEDGWVVINRGQEIVDFLIYQLREAKTEERYADQMRAHETQRRAKAEEKYKALQDALIAALGPKAPEIAEKAIAP